MKLTTKMHPALAAALAGRVFANAARPVAPQQPAGGTPTHPDEEAQIEEMRNRMVEAHGRAQAIRARADADQRDLTPEEVSQVRAHMDEFDSLDSQVQQRERLLAQRQRLAAPAQRRTTPTDAPPAAELPGTPGRQNFTGGEFAGVTSKGAWGFRSMGEFAKAVVNVGKGTMDPRISAAATTYGNETTLADGGFAVPPDFRSEIVKKIEGEESLLPRTDQQTTSSNKLTVPKDDTTPWQTTGGIQAYWEDEAAAMTASKPALGQLEVKANKLTALVPVTDEQLEDAPSLTRYLPGKVADKFTSKINAAIISGNGVGKLQGLLSSGSKVAVAEEDAQDANTVVFMNIANMWSRMYAPLRSGAIWLINQDLEPQLLGLRLPGDAGYPAYLPPGGLSQSPFATLMGRPVIPMEACSTVGTEGDIILTNLKAYLTAQKVGGMRSDVSMHLYFDQAITAFRFILRCGGQSWWSAPAARANGNNTLSNIVTLADRAGGG